MLLIRFSQFFFFFFFSFFKRFYFYLFFERWGWREKKRERNINVWLPITGPSLGTWPATQACALTGSQTRDPLVHRLTLNPLSQSTSQSNSSFFFFFVLLCLLKHVSSVFPPLNLCGSPIWLIIQILWKTFSKSKALIWLLDFGKWPGV